WLGIMSMAEFFPVVFFSPLAGFIADRRNQVNVIRTTQVIGGIQATVLAILVATGWITIEYLLALTLLLGITNSFAHPSPLALFAVTTIGTRGFVELFPGFADSVFGMGPAGLSMLVCTVGLGAICGGAWMLVRQAIAGLTTVVLANTVLMSVAVLAFTAADNF